MTRGRPVSRGFASLDGPGLWESLNDAALGRERPLSCTVARMMAADGHARLGWVVPPQWETVAQVTGMVLRTAPLAACERLIVVGMGGWGFAAHALSALGGAGLLPLDSLDSCTVRSVLQQADGPDTAACLAISASRGTAETRLLAEMIKGAWTGTHVVWLSDDDRQDRTFALSSRGIPDQVALFGAPVSTAFLVPAAFAAGAGLERAYGAFFDRYQGIGAKAASLAASAPADGRPHLILRLPRQASDAARLWVTQLARQALCGKSTGFDPWVDVECGVGESGPADAVVDIDHMADADPLPRLMGMFYAAGVFTACLGIRAGIKPATHGNVREYKRRVAAQPVRSRYPLARRPETPDALIRVVCDWLSSRSDARAVHIVVYDRQHARAIRELREAVTDQSGLRCEIHEGSQWNHHSYQAVYGNPAVAVIVVAVGSPARQRADRLDRCLAANADMRYAIAVATHQSLGPRSLFIELARYEP